MRKTKGFTLIEILIASSLFAVVLSMVCYMFLHTSERSERGMVKIEAQRAARAAVDFLAADLKQSALLPLNTNGRLPMPSAVVFPDAYTQADNRVGVHADSVVFSSMNPGARDARDLRSYSWIQYRRVGSRLVRRVFEIEDAASSTGVRGLSYSNGWLFSPGSLADLLPRDERVVTALPSPVDTLALVISHARLPAPDYQYGINFDRSLYRISVEVTLHPGANVNKQETQSYETQASLVTL